MANKEFHEIGTFDALVINEDKKATRVKYASFNGQTCLVKLADGCLYQPGENTTFLVPHNLPKGQENDDSDGVTRSGPYGTWVGNKTEKYDGYFKSNWRPYSDNELHITSN